jgi:hypothetical protein
MTQRDAMGYEYLIRKAFKCGRHGAPGANADIFRGYERQLVRYRDSLAAAKNQKQSALNKSIEEIAFDTGVKAGEVAAYMDAALSHVKNKFYENLTEEQKEGFEECQSLLREPTEKNIGDALEKGHELFTELRLSIG